MKYFLMFSNDVIIITQLTGWFNSFVKSFDVSTKIKNNIKESTQCKQWNCLNNEIAWVYWEH